MMHILLVEDTKIEQIHFLGLFRNHKDIQITTAWSLAEGVKRAMEKPQPDIVVLDLGLPDSEIEKTLPRFVEQCPGVPVFVSTSTEDMELAEKLGMLGASGYGLKKNGPQAVLHALACAIGATKREQQIRQEREGLRRKLEGKLDKLKSDSGICLLPPKPKPSAEIGEQDGNK